MGIDPAVRDRSIWRGVDQTLRRRLSSRVEAALGCEHKGERMRICKLQPNLLTDSAVLDFS